ncbi:Hypothetical predicted protein [Cloeon dipterum]|uniref:Uncharacterized protein n=1 Tax=Cloeon dipterum TaxID=197152 RepID=A0A8S1E3E4_9INSE|nr:Hypothetical predicted protein [Cloeon dipterum]
MTKILLGFVLLCAIVLTAVNSQKVEQEEVQVVRDRRASGSSGFFSQFRKIGSRIRSFTRLGTQLFRPLFSLVPRGGSGGFRKRRHAVMTEKLFQGTTI